MHTGITKNGTAWGGYKQIEKIGDYTVVTSSVNYANTSALLVKRGMDIVGGLVGCLFTLIIMIFVGPAIYIASPGPIFFRTGENRQKRQKVQDVQIPQHVYGCRGAKERTHGTE